MNLPKQKILVVDDAPDNIAMLRNTLHPEYKVFFALSGQEALELVASPNKPDLVLLDILMPDMDGFEVCRRLKTSERSREIPVIFITAKSEAEIETKGLELGAVDFITKPFNPPVVRARVRTHLNLIRTFEQLKEREHHLRSILEAAMDAIITTDQMGIVLDFNPFAETLFGYGREEAIGRNIADLIIPPEYRGKHRISMQQYADLITNNQAHPLKRRMELSAVCANGEHIMIEMALVTTYRQGQLCFTAFLSDITERNNLLQSLNDMLKTAEEASRAKSDFLANMSHEIRTPMNAIVGLTKLALKADLSPKVLDYLTKIDNASRSMLGIINDILEYSRIEAGHLTLNPAPFDIQCVFDHLGDLFRRLATDKGLELIFSLPEDNIQLMGDAMRLEQVLTNLIGNAIKFTERGEILVEATLTDPTSERIEVQFSVRDSGIGIDPHRLPDLFESFVQADTSITRRYGGTGLGLAISKRIVSCMGGKIWAESQPGSGSLFRFTALFTPVETENKKRYTLPESITPLRAIIVDSKPNSRTVLAETLRLFSINVTAVGSLLEATNLLLNSPEPPNTKRLFVLNLREFEQRELEAYGRLLQNLSERGRALPKTILLTSILRKELLFARAAILGIDSCIENPVNRSHLFNTILEIFGCDVIHTRAAARGEEIQEGQIKQRIGGARILVVEDNAINMQVIRELLERVGLIVEGANHGRKALELLKSREYLLILMDLQMPEMDGFTATRLIRADPRFAKLPIIAMTAHAMEEDRNKCLMAGMNGHVGKPFDPPELYEMLARWIEMEPTKEPVKQTASTLDLPHPMPGLHTKEGIMRVGGDAALYQQLLRRFRTDHAQEADQIADALQRGDRLRAERLAHTIKSAAGQLGAIPLHLAAATLEKAIAHQEPDETHRLEAFRGTLHELLTTLDHWIPEPMPTEPPRSESVTSPEPAEVLPLLEQLATLLAEQDSTADTLLQPLRKKLAGDPAEKTVDNIEQKLRQYDYDAAAGLLEKLVKNLR